MFRQFQPVLVLVIAALGFSLQPLTQRGIENTDWLSIFFPFLDTNPVLMMLRPLVEIIRSDEVAYPLSIGINTALGFYFFRLGNLGILVANLNLVPNFPLFLKTLFKYMGVIGCGTLALSIFEGFLCAWFIKQQLSNVPVGLANLTGAFFSIIPFSRLGVDFVNDAYAYNKELLNTGYAKRKQLEIQKNKNLSP